MNDEFTSEDIDESEPIITRKFIGGTTILLLMMVAIWLGVGTSPLWLLPMLPCNLEIGTFGDMFGFTNALFSALAFGGVIATLYLQLKELRENRIEYKKMVKAQNAAVKTAWKSAQLNATQSEFDSLSRLISLDITVSQFIAVRNSLYAVSREFDSARVDRTQGEPVIPKFEDDQLAIEAEKVLMMIELINDKPSDHSSHLNVIAHDLVNSISNLKMQIRKLSFTNEGDRGFLAPYFRRAKISMLLFESASDQLAKLAHEVSMNQSASTVGLWDSFGSLKGRIEKEIRILLNMFRKHGQVWAKLGTLPKAE